MKYKAAIFDMDGTVLDTIEDLADAVRYVMKAEGHRSDFETAEVRHFFGSGVSVAFERALAYEAGANLESLQRIGTARERFSDETVCMVKRFSEYYPAHCEEKTKPFEGIPEALLALRNEGVRLALVSNKIDSAVQIMTEGYFPEYFDFATGLSDKTRRKPHPDMVEKCLAEMDIRREEAVYVGDSEIDIQTAEASGLDCISVDWGFRNAAYLRNHGAAKIISTPEELVKEIRGI